MGDRVSEWGQACACTVEQLPGCPDSCPGKPGQATPCVPAAKSGNDLAAMELIGDTLDPEQVRALRQMMEGHAPVLVSAHAFESPGVNAMLTT